MSISVDVKALGEDIISSYHERIGMINRLQKNAQQMLQNTRQMLQGFRSDRNEMAIKDKNQRLKEVKSLANATGSLLKGFRSERIGVDANLHKTFKNYHRERKEMMGNLMESLNKIKEQRHKAVAEIRRDTKSLLNDCAAERNKMAATWQAMHTALAKKRGVSPVAEQDAETNPAKRKGSKKRSRKGRK